MPEPGTPPKDPLTEPEPWNAIAIGYDEEFFEQLPGFVERAISMLGAPPEGVVLDLATGPGTFAVRAARRVGKVVAVDFAEQMVVRLRAHLEREGIGNVDALVMDGHHLSFPEASFDAVVSMFGWFLFADRSRALAEIHRVLRPSGRALVTSWATLDRNTVLGVGLEALRHALPELPRPKGPLPTQDPEVCASELRSAGFRDVESSYVTANAEFASVAAYSRTMLRASAPYVMLRKKLGEQAFGEAMQRSEQYLEAKLGSGPITLQAEAIFTTGVRASP